MALLMYVNKTWSSMNFNYWEELFFFFFLNYFFLHPTLRTNSKCVYHKACYFHLVSLYWFIIFFLCRHSFLFVCICHSAWHRWIQNMVIQFTQESMGGKLCIDREVKSHFLVCYCAHKTKATILGLCCIEFVLPGS